MKQSRLMSLVESVVNILAGFGISLAAQWFFLPLLGVSISFSQNLQFALIMTGVSIARSFVLRRMFEALHIRRPLSPFMQAVIEERFRQVEKEGWSLEHDDAHDPGDLARAGAAYLFSASVVDRKFREPLRRWYEESASAGLLVVRNLWPWSWDWWKPDIDDRRHDLIRGCALGIAEGEKFDRSRRGRQ